MEKEPHELPFLHSIGKRETKPFSRGSNKKPTPSDSTQEYLWGYVVGVLMMISAVVFLLHEIDRSGGLYLTLLSMVLFVVVSSVGILTKRIWGLLLFSIYAVLVGLLSLLAVLLSPLAGGPSSSDVLWIILVVVLGPASLPYFYRRRTVFKDLGWFDLLALGVGLILLLSFIFVTCSTSPVPKITFD